jgi:hypothetical protein
MKLISTKKKEEYIKKAKILLWKLKGDNVFVASCREHNIDEIKDKFKGVMLALQDYISFCSGRSKNYTYKLLNSNVTMYNSGKDPVLPNIITPPSKRVLRELTRHVDSPKTLNRNKINALTTRIKERKAKSLLRSTITTRKERKALMTRIKEHVAKNLLKSSMMTRKSKLNNENHNNALSFHTAHSGNNNNNALSFHTTYNRNNNNTSSVRSDNSENENLFPEFKSIKRK